MFSKMLAGVAIWFVLLTQAVIVQAEEPGSVLSVDDLKVLAGAIKATEDSLLNIKIESEMWVETKADLDDPCEPWERTPVYVSCTAWFDGNPDGKVRVDVHKQVLEWQDGAAPYGESSFSDAFDGQYGGSIIHSTGYSGKMSPVKEGRILPERPSGLKSGWYDRFTGRNFTVNFFFEGRDYVFSDIFTWACEPNYVEKFPFEFSLAEFQGVECIKMATKGPKTFEKSWWLDPSRGFALLGHKSVTILEDGTERLKRSINVSKLKEVADGIWWPTQVSVVLRPYGDVKHWQRYVYRASNVLANDPNFDDSIFTLDFPAGYKVHDKITGTNYVVGEKQ